MSVPTLGLTMMVRNEERVIARAIASAREYVSEILVIDTGSTDGTVAAAERSGAKILHYPWTDDYSAPRNAGIEAMGSDWILQLDADEMLDPRSLRRLPELLSDERRWAYLVKIVTPSSLELGAPPADILVSARLFRRRPEVRYRGAVHEVIHFDAPERWTGSDIVIMHLGPVEEPDFAGSRSAKYARILEDALASDPANGYHWMHLALERTKAGDEPGAIDAYVRCLQTSRMSGMNMPSVTRNLATLQNEQGRYLDALQTVGRAIQYFPDFPDLHCLAGEAFLALRRPADAERAFRKALEIRDFPTHYASSREQVAHRARQGLAQVRR